MLLVAATTGYQTRSFTEAARKLGVEITMATDRCHVLEDPWSDNAIPIKLERLLESAESLADLRVDAIIGLGDRPAVIAALAARELSVPFHSPDSARASTDKRLSRECLSAAGLPVPENYLIPVEEAVKGSHFYPCVLKPLGLSGSRGVIRANDDYEFREAFRRIRGILERPEIRGLQEDRDRFIQVERYIEGREFAVEGMMTGGSLQVLAIFDKPDPLTGPFFEETIYVTPSREPRVTQLAIMAAVREAVAALCLSHGPVHAEVRVDTRQERSRVYVLEVAPRPIGGLCSRCLRFPGAFTLEEVILRHALGEDLPAVDAEAAGVMMIPIPRGGIYQNTDGIPQALSVPGIEDVVITAKVGQELLPLPEGASYLGFLFARGPDAEIALRRAFSCLSFEISRTLPITK